MLASRFAGSVKLCAKMNTQIPSPLHVCQRVSLNSSSSGQDRTEPGTEDAQEGRQRDCVSSHQPFIPFKLARLNLNSQLR